MQNPSPIFANYPTACGRLHWWFLLAALAGLLLSLNFGSAGVTRGGDEDEGSGIGGTGRHALPGSESGLGGTGLRPFVTLNAEREIEVTLRLRADIMPVIDPAEFDIPPVQPVTRAPVAAPVTVAQESLRTRDSGPIDISEQIQRDLDSNALTFQRLRAGQDNGPMARASARVADDGLSQETQAYLADAATAPDRTGESTAGVAEAPTTEADGSDPVHGADTVSWQELAGFLAENAAARDDEEKAGEADTTTRLSRPERLQRPELPQVQRVRPIQRAAVLPPRIKPLAL